MIREWPLGAAGTLASHRDEAQDIREREHETSCAGVQAKPDVAGHVHRYSGQAGVTEWGIGQIAPPGDSVRAGTTESSVADASHAVIVCEPGEAPSSRSSNASMCATSAEACRVPDTEQDVAAGEQELVAQLYASGGSTATAARRGPCRTRRSAPSSRAPASPARAGRRPGRERGLDFQAAARPRHRTGQQGRRTRPPVPPALSQP